MKVSNDTKAFLFSTVLHSALLIPFLLHAPPGGGGGEKSGTIISKQVEVEVVQSPPVTKDDSPVEVKKPKVAGLTECENDSWYGGVGIQQDPSTYTIELVGEGYPAQKAGLRIGDVVHTLNGEDLRGDPGTRVTVTVTRAGQTFNVEIIRDKICIGARK